MDDLKLILEKIVKQLEEEGIDLEETPALFKWVYPDNPRYEFQLLIKIDDGAEHATIH